MDERIEKYLYDVKLAIDAIRQFTKGKTEEDFNSELIIRSAVERQYLIIGEALSRIRKQDLGTVMLIRENQKIIGFRNVLAHGYDEVKNDVSWAIITDKLDALEEDVNKLLKLC